MGNGVYRAVSGSVAQMRRLDVLANNLAHVDTPGFKEDRLRFTEALDEANRGTWFVDTPQTRVALQQGAARQTGNELDVALTGEGFFVVETPSGTRLTRSGRFAIAPTGLLCTTSGDTVLGESGPIAIPPVSGNQSGLIRIGSDGDVTMGDQTLGRLKRVVAPADQLEKADGRLFHVVGGDVESLPPAMSGEVLQGHIEESNVNAVTTMTQIIEVQRTFESLQQAVRMYRDLDSQSTRRLR